MHGLVTLSMQELDRLKSIQAVVEGSLKPVRAAERLGMTSRQVRRLASRYRLEGPVGLVSRRRNQPSNNRMDACLASFRMRTRDNHDENAGGSKVFGF